MADATPLIDPIQKDVEGTKQGSKFYGCCCDSRRAVIVLNTLDIVFSLALYITFVVVDKEEMTGEQAAVWIVNQVWNAATILGAFCYSDIVVIMGVMWQLFKIIGIIYVTATYYAIRSMESHVATICYLCIEFPLIISTIYANILFAHEVRKDIMSKETYKRERHSCCCV